MKENKICCFTGHRVIAAENGDIRMRIRGTVESLAKDGYTDFRCGGALGFDTLAALEVIRLKDFFPEVKLIMYLPCRDQCSRWQTQDVKIYEAILAKADEVYYSSEFYSRTCMHERNVRLVTGADTCVAYYHEGSAGGTAFTVKYAKRNGVNLINLAHE